MAKVRLVIGDPSEAAVMSSEEVTELAGEIAAISKKRSEDARRRLQHRAHTVSAPKPDVSERLRDDLRLAIEREITTVRTAVHGAVQPSDLERETMKKALADLHLAGLRKVARKMGEPTRGNVEELATRVAQALHWREEEIAQLIVDNQPEPIEATSWVSRLFPLDGSLDLELVNDRLSFVLGRYIRVGIARWFVFDTQDADSDFTSVRIGGSYKAYTADVRVGGDRPHVVAERQVDGRAEVTFNRSSVAMFNQASAQVASAAASALEEVSPVAFSTMAATKAAYSASSYGLPWQTVVMLDLVANRLHAVGLSERNLTVVRFRMSSDAHTGRGPALRAVRFEGDHLLDSPTACRLAGPDRRPLIEVALKARLDTGDPSEFARFPLRLTLHDDHISVMTGQGSDPSLAHEVHRRAVEATRGEVLDGVSDYGALADLIGRIHRRATATEEIDEADILGDNYADSEEETALG